MGSTVTKRVLEIPKGGKGVASATVWLWPCMQRIVGHEYVGYRTAKAFNELGVPSGAILTSSCDTSGLVTVPDGVPFLLVHHLRYPPADQVRDRVKERASAYAVWLACDGESLKKDLVPEAMSADVAITISEVSANTIRAAGVKNVIVIPVGVDLEDWICPREAIGGPSTFLWRGSSPHRKGLDLFLRAFSMMEDSGVRAVVMLPNEGLCRDQAKKFADSRIEWIGGFKSTEEVREVCGRCDVAVAPSRSEAFNICALESMASGLPLIYAGGTGMDDFANGAGVWIPDSGVKVKSWIDEGEWSEPDVDALAQAMYRVSTDPKMLEEMSIASIKRAKEWSWENVAKVGLSRLREKGLLQWA